MSPAVDGVSAHEAMDSAYNQGVLSGKSLLCATALGFKHELPLWEEVIAPRPTADGAYD